MKWQMKRPFGMLLVLVGTLSLVLSLFCASQVWRLRLPFQEGLLNGLELIDSTLEATTGALALAHDSLNAASSSADTLAASVETLGKSLQDTAPLLETLATLVGEDFPQTIGTAKTSLQSAQTSARLIDSVLRALTFFNRDLYNPPVPLHTALSQVSSSLDGLPGSFATMEASLVATNRNLTLVEEDVTRIAADIELINTNLKAAEEVIAQYQQVLAKITPEIGKLESMIPRWVTWLAYSGVFIFFWLGLAQISLILRGWELAFGMRKE